MNTSMLGRAENLVGKTFGQLSVLAFHDKKGVQRRWLCRCSCGRECLKYGNQMKAGQVISCGCLQKKKAREIGQENASDLTGKRFGRLLVISRSGSNRHQKANWICQCDCGGKKVAPSGHLISGNTKSCGCIQKETMHRIRFNPNMTDEERFTNQNRQYAYPTLHLWRQEIHRRNRWTCLFCGIKSPKKLIAHHADGWKGFPEKRLDESNGVCLCVPCHKSFHATYGYTGNTRSQVDEYYSLVRGW